MRMPPLILDTRGTLQPSPLTPGFSGKGIEPIPGSLGYRFGQIPGSHGNLKPIEVSPEAYTPRLSRVSNPYYSELQQKHANALFQSRVQYHHSTYPPNVVPSSAPQSKPHDMFDEAKKYAGLWSQQHQQPQQQQQQQQQQQHQQQQQQQRPHTNARQRAKMTRERALHIMRLPAGSNPANGVRKAFRKAALKYHPDKTTADRKEVAAAKANKYKKIHKAYNVLLTNSHADVDDTSDYSDDDDGMAKTGGNNTIKRRHKKHKHAKKTRGKKHSNRRSKTRGKTYRKTRKNTTKRR